MKEEKEEVEEEVEEVEEVEEEGQRRQRFTESRILVRRNGGIDRKGCYFSR